MFRQNTCSPESGKFWQNSIHVTMVRVNYFFHNCSLPACRRLLFPLLHAEKGRLRNAVANRVPASRWQGILFRINREIISG